MVLLREDQGDILVLTFEPETLELKNVPEFKAEMEEYLTMSRKILLDMRHIEFIDSTGCGALLACKKRADKKEDGSRIHLCEVSKQVMATFRLIRFNRVLQIHETREEGVKSLGDEIHP